MRRTRFVAPSLLLVAAVALAGLPRIVKRSFSDATFLTVLRAATWAADGSEVPRSAT